MAAKNSTLTQARLKELLHYDPDTGLFTRLVRTSNRIKVGDIAGWIRKDGYVAIRAEHPECLAHRLAWLYMTGSWPKDQVDHINGVRSDNAFKNLREATSNINNQNIRKPRSDNKLRLLGVCYKKDRRKYVAQIMVKGNVIWLGQYTTAYEAHRVYIKAKRNNHAGCTI